MLVTHSSLAPVYRLCQATPVTCPGRYSSPAGLHSSDQPSLDSSPSPPNAGVMTPPECLAYRKAKARSGTGVLCLKHVVVKATSGQTVPLLLCSSSDPDSRRWECWWDFLGGCLVAIWNPPAVHAVCWTSVGLPRLLSDVLRCPG